MDDVAGHASRLPRQRRKPTHSLTSSSSLSSSFLSTLLLLALLAPSTSALQCRAKCSVPSSAVAPFCAATAGKHLPSCSTDSAAADTEASSRYAAVLGGLNTTHALSPSCGASLRKFECLRSFPVCVFSQEFNLLCRSACTQVLKDCQDDPIGQKLSLESLGCVGSDIDGISTTSHCLSLDYSGPNRVLFLIGFLINVVFSFCAALGINLQKHSLHTHDESIPPFKQKPWLIGFSLIVSGSVLDFVAFGLAPQSFLAPLAALSLVWNMLLAPRFHGEKLTRQNFVATFVICIGVTLTVIYSSHDTPKYLLSDLVALYQKPVMYAYVLIVLGSLVSLFFLARHLERSGQTGGLLHIVCYGAMAGTFGGCSVTLAKSTVELIKSSIAGGDAFSHAATYVIVCAMACCLLAQISFLNAGLRMFDALVVVPVYQAFWILMSILGGLVYFEEYTSLSLAQQVMFVLGTCVTVAGIMYLLQTRQAQAQALAITPATGVPKGLKHPHQSPQPSFSGPPSVRAGGVRRVGVGALLSGRWGNRKDLAHVYSPVGMTPDVELGALGGEGVDERDGGRGLGPAGGEPGPGGGGGGGVGTRAGRRRGDGGHDALDYSSGEDSSDPWSARGSDMQGMSTALVDEVEPCLGPRPTPSPRRLDFSETALASVTDSPAFPLYPSDPLRAAQSEPSSPAIALSRPQPRVGSRNRSESLGNSAGVVVV